MPDPFLSTANSSGQVHITSDNWTHILQQTDNFKFTEVLQGALNAQQIVEFKQYLFEAISYNCRQQQNISDLRIYVGGKQISNDSFIERLYPDGHLNSDDGMQKISKAFSQYQLRIGLNYSEKFNIKIAEILSDLIQPLLECIGMPTSGLHTTAHISNYKFSPQDTEIKPTISPAIHFHLGPADQVILAWKASSELLTGGENTITAAMVPEVKSYHLKAGDLFFMPEGYHFVKQAEEFSIGLTLWLGSDQNKYLFKKILNGTLNDFKIALFSNRGWRELPLTLNELSGFNAEEGFQRLKSKYIQLPYPFRIYYKILKNEQLAVYARGAKIILKYHHLIPELIERLNTNEIISTNSLLLELNRKWPESAGLYFLAILYNKRAINLLDYAA